MRRFAMLRKFLVSCVLVSTYAENNTEKAERQRKIMELLNNGEARQAYIDCLIEKGPCFEEADEIKRILPEAVQRGCALCSETQKIIIGEMMSFLSEKQPEILKSLTQNIDPKGELVKVLIANTKIPESNDIRKLDPEIRLDHHKQRPMDDQDFISKLDEYHKNLLYPHSYDKIQPNFQNDIISNEILVSEKPEIVRTEILTVHAHSSNQNNPDRNRPSENPALNQPPQNPIPFNQAQLNPAQFHHSQQVPIQIDPIQQNIIPINRENDPRLVLPQQNIIPLNLQNNPIPQNPSQQNHLIEQNSFQRNPISYIPTQQNQIPLNPPQQNHIIHPNTFQQNQMPLNPSQPNRPDYFQQNQIPLNPHNYIIQPNSFQGNPIPFNPNQQNPLMPDPSQQNNVHPHSIIQINPSNANFDPHVLQELQMAPPHLQEALLQQLLMEQNMNEHNLPQNHVQVDQQMRNQMLDNNQNHIMHPKNAVKILENPKQTAEAMDKISADENYQHAVKQRPLIIPHRYYYYQ